MGLRAAGLDRLGLGLLFEQSPRLVVETLKEAEELSLSWVGERTSSALELWIEGGAFSLLSNLLPDIVIIFLKAFSLFHRLLEGFVSLVREVLTSGAGLGGTMSELSTALMLK
jgi:hypothetical protein